MNSIKRLFDRSRPLRWALPVLVLLGMVILQWWAPDWAARPEAWTVDQRFEWRGPEEPHNKIVIVALDEFFFEAYNENRETDYVSGQDVRILARADWAELVARIAAGEPKVIGLDVDFATPGRDEGGDEVLAEALETAGNVVLASRFELPPERIVTGTHRSLLLPTPNLREVAAGVGVVNLPGDDDGAIRRVTLVHSVQGGSLPAFSVAVATQFLGHRPSVEPTVLGGDWAPPIHFRGSEGTFETVSATEVLASEDLCFEGDEDWCEAVEPSTFKSAIVLVGYTTELEHDRHRTPFAREGVGMPGVEIHANAIDTLLVGDWLHSPPVWLPILLVGVAGLVALVALNLSRPGLGVVLLLAGVVLYGAVGVIVFNRMDYVLPLVAPVAAALTVGGTALGERMIFAERDKRRIRQRFAGVMSPERLEAVLDGWETLMEEDRPQKEAAVLFADVRGFTSATESLMRQGRSPEMVRFLSAYLDAMAEAVFAEGGVVYDVVGDGLMILFGVPECFPDYALRAARAAVRMARATVDLQEVWPLRDERPLGMGIGVHCGSVVDAVVGRGRRVEYAVIGDPVNTAARIEAHCKVAMEIPPPPGGEVPDGVTILLSADLYEKVRDHVLVDQSVPPFEARGKSEPLGVVRLLGLRE